MNMKEHMEMMETLQMPKAQIKKIQKHIESLPEKREALPGSKISKRKK